MSPSKPGAKLEEILADRSRLGDLLVVVGVCGVVASVIVGVAGWVLAGRAIETVETTLDPISRIVVNVSESIEASQVIFDRTTDVVTSIETATRSTVRTVTSVSDVLGETAQLTGSGIADSLDSAVDTLPGLVASGRVVDRTMRALSFVGVDYDPAVPLDQALGDLESSLAPIPDQIRAQVELLENVRTDLDQIAEDGRELSSTLVDIRIEMLEAERVLASAAANAATAAESVMAVDDDISTYYLLARAVVVAAAIALLAGAVAPLAIGLHLRRPSAEAEG